jgi:biotin carboxyl carrier protein
MNSSDHGTFHISGRSIPYRLLEPNLIEIDGKRYRFYVLRNRNEHTVWLNGRTYHLPRADKGSLAHAATIPATGEIIALMPGKVLRIEVKVGDTVAEKQTVAIMESMKMESALRAPKAGRVAAIHCQTGQVVEMSELLMEID